MWSKNKIANLVPNYHVAEIAQRLLKVAGILIFSYYVGKYLGMLIVFNQYVVPAVICLGVFFLLRSSAKQKFYLLSISAFIPFMFPHLFIRQPRWVELLSPGLCFFMVLDLIMERKKFFSREAKIYYLAIGILVVWSLINFARNPVFGAFFGQGAASSGIRAYLVIFVGITTFFYSFWYFRENNVDASRWLNVLMIFSLVFGYLRLAGYFGGFRVPFLGGIFLFSPESKEFYRIGGLSEMAVLGLAATITQYNNKKWRIQHIFLLFLFFVLLLFSGGRGAFMGLILMFLIYVFVVDKRYLMPVILFLVIGAGSYLMFLQSLTLPQQLQRLTSVEGGIQKQDKYRTKSYDSFLQFFEESPIFGKGIGLAGKLGTGSARVTQTEEEIKREEEEMKKEEEGKGKNGESKVARKRGKALKEEDFATVQSYKGGHGSYLSILSLFGIGGLVYFLIMLYGSVYYSYQIFRQRVNVDIDVKLPLFVFLYLVAHTLIFIPGGSGYDSMELWFLSGMIAGIKAKDSIEDEQIS